MRTFKAALMASVLVTGVSVAYGQVSVDAGANAAAGGEVSTDAGSVAAGADATVNASATVGQSGSDEPMGSYADLSASIASSADLSVVADTADITIVLISSLEAETDATAWAELKSQNSASVDELHASIEANAELNARLTAELSSAGDFTIDDVVAISTAADGSLTIYVDDEA